MHSHRSPSRRHPPAESRPASAPTTLIRRAILAGAVLWQLAGGVSHAHPDAADRLATLAEESTGLAGAQLRSVSAGEAGTVVIPAGATWKYDDTGTDLGTAWREIAYEDSAWASGPAILGYGERYITTEVSYGPDPDDKHPTTYFRIAFEIAEDPIDIRYLAMRARYDDGFVAHLNGTEVTRQSMPAGEVTYTTLADSHEAVSYELIDLSPFVGELLPGTNHLAIEVHQTSPSSSDLVLDLALETSTAPAFVVRGPYLQMGTPEQVTVRWRTSPATASTVRYGPSSGNLSQIVIDSLVTRDHELVLSGLSPGTRYRYSIGTPEVTLAGDDSTYVFRTPPIDGTRQATRVWVVGDSGLPGSDQRAVRDAYRAHTGERGTDLWLMLGDNAYSTGTDAEYQVALFEAYPELLRSIVLWPTRGNHDRLHDGEGNDYYDIFTLPTAAEAGGVASGVEAYYSFDHANIHFVCLDSFDSDRRSGSPMLSWLAADLAVNARDWTIAYWHHPPYSKGSHDSDDEDALIEMRENVLPILEAGGVDLVLCGHSHSYERSFLLDSHYGHSSTLVDSNRVDDGDGDTAGSGAYTKSTLAPIPHEGAVYAVAGSSSRLGGGPLDHPVMVTSLNVLGSMVIDVNGGRLDACFLDDGGAIRDGFTILKGGAVTSATPSGHDTVIREIFFAASPVPSSSSVRFLYSLPRESHVRLAIHDVAGRRVAILADERQPAGLRDLRWDARSARAADVLPGVYFARLVVGDGVITRKLLILR